MKTNYMPASISSFSGHISNSNYSFQEVNKFLKDNTIGVLSCYGASLPKDLKRYSNQTNKFVNKMKKNINSGFCKDLNYWVDSGGFQVLTGKIDDIDKVEALIQNYYDFLENYSELYNHAFILDLPPNENVFDNWRQVANYNKRSYRCAAEMSTHIRDKVIYIQHFTDSNTYRIFNEIMDDGDYFNVFKRFGVGGVAISQFGDLDKSIAYSIPMEMYIRKCLENNRKDIKIHFLGSGQTSYLVTLLYKMTEYFVKKNYNINMEITHDSCPHIKLGKSKTFTTLENGHLYNIDFRSKNLNQYVFKKDMETYILDKLREFQGRFGINIPLKSIYRPDRKQDNDTYVTMVLNEIDLYNRICAIITEAAIDIVDVWESSDDKFYNKTIDLLRMMYGGKITRNMKKESNSLRKYIEIISKPDGVWSSYIINHCKNRNNLFGANNLLTI